MDRVILLLVVLAATAAFSAWWRARDGRVTVTAHAASRPAAQAQGQQRADDEGAPTPAADVPDHHHAWDGLPPEAADVVAAVQPATPLVLVEFTAPDCVPCEATKRILEDETAGRPDVSIAQVDVADALDLARAHRILRAPTTLLVTADGHLLGRVSGVPRVDELRQLLDASCEQGAASAA